MKLEICANSIQSAINAQNAGADRIELCSSLNVGGLTPSYGLIKEVVNTVKIPVNVLIRPRIGGFVYSKNEIALIKHDIEICKEFGMNGIVCGFLNEDNSIDLELTKEILEFLKPLSFTFHRAFDLVNNPLEALEDLVSLQVDCILTSGTKPKAIEGLELLQTLLKKANHRIELMAGSGINSGNVHKFKDAGFKIVHSSASSKIDSNFKSDLFGNQDRTESNIEEIKNMIKKIN